MPTGGQLTIETANVALTTTGSAPRRSRSTRPLRHARHHRHRHRHGRSHARARVRAVLHDQSQRARAPVSAWRRSTASSIRAAVASRCDTAPGRGTSIRIYLPVTTASPRCRSGHRSRRSPTEGTETLLLVEDNDAVREICRDARFGGAAIRCTRRATPKRRSTGHRRRLAAPTSSSPTS